MRELSKVIRVQIRKFSELEEIEKELLKRAAKVRLNAQAPLSHYWVGAAVLSEHETIHVGCNVERDSFTQTTHAEQNAIDTMVAEIGPSSKIKVLATVAGPEGIPIDFPPKITGAISRINEVCVACGHCLQIIWQNCFRDGTVQLIALTKTGEVVSTTIGDAFPMPFGP